MEDISLKRINKQRRVPLPRFYLTERRLELGLSVEKVAIELGVANYYYYQIENGNRGKRLSVNLLLMITKALKMEAEELLRLEAEYIEKYNEINKQN